ncbi:hypothetical protein DP116_21600 [Brasilonema bromeliae SPC951]|uniref:Uncharacterized protein n=1 Tax=Brasilonema bromeliae SPC951 TaxID=385972 RepID=A0ABX1PBQ6_9CYAN|nr:hypothetical protein [Brasilonema bromeliae SPC951]
MCINVCKNLLAQNSFLSIKLCIEQETTQKEVALVYLVVGTATATRTTDALVAFAHAMLWLMLPERRCGL